MKIYTVNDGNNIVKLLSEKGIEVKLIGSLGRGETSKHDIDILLENFDKNNLPTLVYKMRNLLRPTYIAYTDWDGLYFKATIYGDIDLFFDTALFDY